MKTIEESIEIDVPVNVAYNQWTEFGAFPNFMKKVESVALDESSRTSAALVKIIFREFLGFEPRWETSAPDLNSMLAHADAASAAGAKPSAQSAAPPPASIGLSIGFGPQVFRACLLPGPTYHSL